jgi:hypothetical protein
VKEMKEDIYFYLDLTKDILKKKEITKAVKYYIDEKSKMNVQGHYSLLIFQEEGNPIFITDKKDAGIITNSIEENWKLRPKTRSYFENGLFYIFSFIAETVRKKSKFNRIIIITDTPSDLSEDYQEALFNLVSKIKNFPTFIDILRISEGDKRFFSDDVKLNMLASDTKGGIFYLQDKKEFSTIIKKLVKTKQFTSTFIDQPDRIKISTEDYSFYNQLAKTLQKPEKSGEPSVCYLCKEEVCPVCSDVYDIPEICEDCNSGFHNCCITNYTINHNIGIPNILRCPGPSCDVLLKIDEDELISVSGEVEVRTVKEYMNSEVLNTIPRNRPSVQPLPSSFSTDQTTDNRKRDPNPIPESSNSEINQTKTIRIGGFFGKTYTVQKVGDKVVYEKVTKQATFKPASSTPQGSSSPFSINSTKNQPTFSICPQCGRQVNPKISDKCLNCGFKMN